MFFIDDFAGKSNTEDRDDENDESNGAESDSGSESDSDNSNDFKLKSTLKPKSVWEDEDDQNLKISLANNSKLRKLRKEEGEDKIDGADLELRLREKYKAINPTPAWASQLRSKRKQRESDSEDDDDILNSTGLSIITNRKHRLKSGEIKVERLKDIEQSDQVRIVNVEFHPIINNLMLVAQSDRRIKIYNVEGSNNTLIQQIHLKDLPITTAIFNPTQPLIFIGGLRPFSYTYNLQSDSIQRFKSNFSYDSLPTTHCKFNSDGSMLAISGRRGYIYLLNFSKSGGCAPIGNIKMNKNVIDFTWSNRNPSELYSISEDTQIFKWNTNSKTCLNNYKDNDSFSPIKLSISYNDQYLSIGLKSGIINIYDLKSNFKLLKSLGNLTTQINNITFNKDTQLLVESSNVKKDQLRLIHLPSLTVFSNWPTSNTPLGKVESVDFSTDGRWLVIGNQRGKLLLYHIKHYSQNVAY